MLETNLFSSINFNCLSDNMVLYELNQLLIFVNKLFTMQYDNIASGYYVYWTENFL